MLHTLQLIQEEFSRRCGRAVLAGGCVRDTLMGTVPKDYDVFVFNDAKPIDSAAFAGLEIITSPEWHKSEPHLQVTLRFAGGIVQVMSSKATNLATLVDTFDWNVSLFGFDASMPSPVIERTKLSAIGPGSCLRLNKVTYPVSTLRRGFRFSERFGMQFDSDELKDLCTMAAGRLAEFKLGVSR